MSSKEVTERTQPDKPISETFNWWSGQLLTFSPVMWSSQQLCPPSITVGHDSCSLFAVAFIEQFHNLSIDSMMPTILELGGHHHRHHKSLTHEGRWRTTDDFTTSFLHFSLFSAALWDMANSRPVYSLMLSSHFFLCLPCLLPPFTVPCKTVLARPEEQETWPYHCNLHLFLMVSRSSWGPIACYFWEVPAQRPYH